MKLNSKSKILIVVLVAGAAYAAGYFSKPAEVKEVTKYKEGKNTTTIVTKYVYPDGTTKEQTINKEQTTVELDSETKTINRNLGVRVSISKELSEQNAYSLDIHSPPLLKLFSTQIGVVAGLDNRDSSINTKIGLYVNF